MTAPTTVVRESLADLIYRTLNPEIQQDAGWVPTIDGTGNVISHIAADAVIADGWVKPKILRTFADVQANPRAIFRDTGGYVGEIQEYLTLADGDDWYWDDQLPITVLWEPQP